MSLKAIQLICIRWASPLGGLLYARLRDAMHPGPSLKYYNIRFIISIPFGYVIVSRYRFHSLRLGYRAWDHIRRELSNMNQEEYFIKHYLSNSEGLVYLYLKEVSSKGGPIKQSMKQIAMDILEKYHQQIVSRSSKCDEAQLEKTFSEATVHRAVRKLLLEGIINVIPCVEKSESNIIIFYGLPEEMDIIEELVCLAEELNQQMHRFRAVLNRKNREMELLRRDRQHLFDEIDELMKSYEDLCNSNKTLNDLLRSISSNCEYFRSGDIVTATKLEDGTIALILKP